MARKSLLMNGMKYTRITRTKNGQYITTIPKAWLEEVSFESAKLLKWVWEASNEGTVIVKAIKARCQHDYTDKETGKWYQCRLEEGHKKWHEYDGVETLPPT